MKRLQFKLFLGLRVTRYRTLYSALALLMLSSLAHGYAYSVRSNSERYNQAMSIKKQRGIQEAANELVEYIASQPEGWSLLLQAQKYNFGFFAVHKHMELPAGHIMLEMVEDVPVGSKPLKKNEKQFVTTAKALGAVDARHISAAVWVAGKKGEVEPFEYATREIVDPLTDDMKKILSQLVKHIHACNLSDVVGVRLLHRKGIALRTGEMFLENTSFSVDKSKGARSVVRVVMDLNTSVEGIFLTAVEIIGTKGGDPCHGCCPIYFCMAGCTEL